MKDTQITELKIHEDLMILNLLDRTELEWYCRALYTHWLKVPRQSRPIPFQPLQYVEVIRLQHLFKKYGSLEEQKEVNRLKNVIIICHSFHEDVIDPCFIFPPELIPYSNEIYHIHKYAELDDIENKDQTPKLLAGNIISLQEDKNLLRLNLDDVPQLLLYCNRLYTFWLSKKRAERILEFKDVESAEMSICIDTAHHSVVVQYSLYPHGIFYIPKPLLGKAIRFEVSMYMLNL